MSNTKDNGFKTLFSDAAKELVEKAKLRCKINKLLDIMIADKERLKNSYAEIGRLYLENEIEENTARIEVLSGLTNHLKDRISRGEAMYKELEAQLEGRESADALKEEINKKIKKAKESTSGFAKNLTDKAKDKTEELSKKFNIKFGKKATEEENSQFLELLEEELKADEETADTAEKTMEKISALLESLDETPDTQQEPAEAPEEITKVVDSIVEEATAELKDTEIAEDFTF